MTMRRLRRPHCSKRFDCSMVPFRIARVCCVVFSILGTCGRNVWISRRFSEWACLFPRSLVRVVVSPTPGVFSTFSCEFVFRIVELVKTCGSLSLPFQSSRVHATFQFGTHDRSYSHIHRACVFVSVVVAGVAVEATYNFTFNGNPWITHTSSADPDAHVWDGTVWVYCSKDANLRLRGLGPDAFNYDHMDGYNVFSSTDLINWVDHGEIFHSRNSPWGPPGWMWAPSAHWNGKYGSEAIYYLYYPHKDLEGTELELLCWRPLGAKLITFHIISLFDEKAYGGWEWQQPQLRPGPSPTLARRSKV